MVRRSVKSNSASLGVSAYGVKAHMPKISRDNSGMTKTPLEVVSENLKTLMLSAGMASADGTPNQSEMKRRSKVDQRTIGRILARELNPSIEKVEQLAKVFGLHAWQMLIPDLDPRNPPVVVMSQAERDFYKRIEELRMTEPPPHKYNLT